MTKYIRVNKSARSRLRVSTFSKGVDFFTDEAVQSPSVAKDCYNFDFSGGALKAGYGLESAGLFEDISVVTVFNYRRYDKDKGERDDRILCVDESGALYEKKGDGVERVGGVTFSEKPLFINYRLYGDDVVFICSAADGTYLYDGVSAPKRVESAPRITSLALHGERLFVTVDGEKSSVWFSDDLDPTNWDASLSGGGFIQMLDERGSLNRVISYLGYLYVFREYGISRVSATGAQTEFSVSNLFTSGGKIYPDTVALCGDHIVFLAEDGLYSFDGLSTKRLLKGVDGLIRRRETARAAYASGKLYLAFNRDRDEYTVGCESGEYQNNALLVLDLSAGSYSLSRGFDIRSFAVIDGEIIAVDADGRTARITACGCAYGTPLVKRWKMPLTDLGVVDKKRVREVYLHADCPVRLTLTSDSDEKTLSFGGGGAQRIRTSFCGHRIGLSLECDEKTPIISRPTLTVTANGF